MCFIFTINLSRQEYHKEINIYQKKNFQFFLALNTFCIHVSVLYSKLLPPQT